MTLNRGLPGETPLDDISGLIPKYVKTVAQLSEAEIANIVIPVTNYLSRRPTTRMVPFTRGWMLRLHKEMFGDVWVWAGQPRRTELNVGVPAHAIELMLEGLAQDIAYWEENGGDVMVQAAGIHHRSVHIRPFKNGNGRWSDDLKRGLEWEIQEIDKGIREARKAAALAHSLQAKLEGQKQIKALEATRSRKRRELFDAQDAIDAQREELIANIEKQLKQRRSVRTLFAVRWGIR